MKFYSIYVIFKKNSQYAQGHEYSCFTYSKIFKVTVKVPCLGSWLNLNSYVSQDVTLKVLHGLSTINSPTQNYKVQSENKTFIDINKLSMAQGLVLFCWTTVDLPLWLAAANIHFGQECVILQHIRQISAVL